jgi:hypothetical protein
LLLGATLDLLSGPDLVRDANRSLTAAETDIFASAVFSRSRLHSLAGWSFLRLWPMSLKNKRPVCFLLTQHWLSQLGAVLLASALISWLFVLPQHIRGRADNPYIGIVVFLVLPAIVFTGSLLVPVGFYLSKRQICSVCLRRFVGNHGYSNKHQ